MIKFHRIFLAILVIGLTLACASCKKDNGDVYIDEPTEEVDSSTVHVFNQHIDSGFVFGRWTLSCYYTESLNASPPYNSYTETNCIDHPIYQFYPNGLLYTYTYNQLGDTMVLDSAIYWYQNNGHRLRMLPYRTELDVDNNVRYIATGAINEQQISYNDSLMFWNQTTGGSTIVTRNFIRKD